MFSIIISEKGGAERRESYDKNEINVGRVQDNDLTLPKGNVSKHHARLLFRDGRFIVTDLKSTNGTYVNGRKIAQATIVREGDKIYIGDFVLRLESSNGSAAPPPDVPSPEEESIRTLARDHARPPAPLPNPPAVTLKAPTHPPGAPLPRPQPQNVSNAPPPVAPPRGSDLKTATPGYPLDSDPDDSAPVVPKPRMPSAGPPPLAGQGARPMTMPLNQMSPPLIGQRAPSIPPPLQQPPTAQPMAPVAAPRAPEPPPPPPAAPPPTPAAAHVASAPPARPTPSQRVPPKEPPAQAARRLAMTMLMGRIAEATDLSPLRDQAEVPDALAQQLERVAREQADAMRDEGEAPQDVDLDALVRDAHRELTGLGAFGPLLDDEDVREIHCVRYDQVFTVRSGGRAAEGTVFSSEEALERVIGRLASQSGEPWKPGEVVLERRLPRASVVAIAKAAAGHHVVSIRKRQRHEASLDELARAGALSRPMAQFLEACVAARANVLVTGAAPPGTPSLTARDQVVAALAASGEGGDRVCVISDVEDVAVGAAHAVVLTAPDTREAGEERVRAAMKLHPDRLVVTSLAGSVAIATIDAMTEGATGVVGAMRAPTLRQGLSRLVGQLVLHRHGVGLDGVREVVGETFDLGVEVAELPDGRARVVRVAELNGADAKGVVARDIFLWSADAQGGDGTFSATGVVPRIAGELASRGMKLDPSLFKRGGR